jgi:hypothetical protein
MEGALGIFFQQSEVIAAIIGAIVGGIIGILGSVATIIITSIIKNRGKLVIYTNNSKITYTRRDNTGGFVNAQSIHDAEDITVSIVCDLYNQSDIPKNLADFTAEISYKKAKKYFDVKGTQIIEGRFPLAVTLPTIIIFPKQTESIHCKIHLKPTDVTEYKHAGVYLIAVYPDKKQFRERVLEIDFTKNEGTGVDKNGRILVLVWKRDKPNAQPWKYENTLGKDWSGLTWGFWGNNLKTVTLYFDNFSQVSFSKFKN